ncbi:hypothetical protein PTTG_29887 [Puccinia triticina 1-1 BBBD Race 1]|uniref:Helicase ATP-binding domain-containing protein n=1 Tax=Puccinia triticina (isolate 1-1 / race 1 (BBBD)) TaxID=630390 RepID=A0A180G1C9_PUCT1|nr:hypothetical protein PTTG_29887 [Puccinia triticina 1-1 BBBD Race 1]
MKLRAFVVIRRGAQPELWGCVFAHSEHVNRIQEAFAAAQVELIPIWNYNPHLFFDIPQSVAGGTEASATATHGGLLGSLRQCRTQLKPHQLTAIEFLRKNKSPNNEAWSLWLHPVNAWIRSLMNEETPEIPNEFKSRGSILADDMGLGKTLTTLAFVLATADAANEIRIHFKDNVIPYNVFHGTSWKSLSRQQLQSALVVLTTYEMIGDSGRGANTNQLTIESLNLCWYRIVLDEAHLMRNPIAHRTLNIQQLKSSFCLCLTGTPVQNCLADLQSLIATLKIAPWDNELIWKQCLIPRMRVGAPEAIMSLNRLMHSCGGARHGKKSRAICTHGLSRRLADCENLGSDGTLLSFSGN